ncbi:MAG: glycosyltransferase family 87 protein, partial [Blastocatellia bacterium]
MKTSPALTFSPGFKRVLLGIAALNGLVGIKRTIESFGSPQIYKKDFIQEYLMAKAVLNGVNPYLPLPELAKMWMSHANYIELNHPTPHPPVSGLFTVPFALLSYETAAIIWLFFELACLLASVSLLLRWWGGRMKARTVAACFAFALGWAPVTQDLWFSQLSCCLLLLLIGAWLALREGDDALGGALLGGLIALKLMAWPVVIFLALRRGWRGVLAAGAVMATTHLLVGVVAGFNCVKDYYVKIGPLLASFYRPHDSNFSAWTWGHRLFVGGGENISAPPLWSSVALAHLFTYVAPLAILAFGMWLALRAKRFDTAFGALVCVAILV